ncbi:lovastatin nonaketide synthase [Colletotrichum tofieldiae]|nr:lovastatin nonaketide synthase [Colletotrichum tofieldiae]
MSSTANEPIAIVGMGCRFAGDATSPSKLWDLLSSPHEVAQDIPPTRFNISRFYHPSPTHHGTTATKQAYLLSEDVRLFDTKFFAVPPAESEVIDPQQRQLLEVVYEALESAGLAYDKLAGSDTACFVGLMSQEYFALQGQDVNMVRTYAGTGTAASNASSRVSYFFDWHGPCMTIDTACSSSMVGVNEAVQALRNGTSRVAVACGTNLVLSPLSFITLSKLNMLSPTGRCRMWDADADGYARGEGVAAIVLKTLRSALEDGDEVLSVIREIGVNHDGRTKGLTMPSAAAQAALIRQTYAKAGLDLTKRADRCQFFEAHGTGTAVGDPQEAEAISSAMFSPESGTDLEEILVGSIKTVVGHTEGTAGVAGLIKTTLALREGIVPPNLLFNRLNPALEPFVSHLRIPTSCEPWPEVAEGGVRRASVNSFGFGGSNAHVILESFAGDKTQTKDEDAKEGGKDEGSSAFSVPVPFVFSAASKPSLSRLIEGIVGYLDQHTGNDEAVDMSALAYTLSTKRSTLSQRVAIPAISADQLRQKIKANLEADDDFAVQATSSGTADAPCLLGIFTGQGAQWPAMGAKLVATVPMAREILRLLDSSIATLPADHRPDWTLTHALSKNDENSDNNIWQSRVNEAAFSQPLCTAVQIILVDLLHAAGVKFHAVVGHSSGEIAAAYAAGFLTARDAIRIAYYRGFFATKLAVGLGGKMLAVGTSLEDAEELCQLHDFAGKLSVAAHNAPSSVTLSGDAEAVVRAEAVFLEEKKFARVLRVDTAYHSHHMMVCAEAYLAALTECGVQALQPAEGDGTLPQWFSSVYGGQQVSSSTEQGLGGQYWVDNMTKPVLFYTAIQTCLTAATFGTNTIMGVVEVGPHPALQAPATESILQVCGKDLPYSGTLRRGQDDAESFSNVLGYLWTRFGPNCVNLGRFQEAFHQASSSHDSSMRVLHNLPAYPWNHDRVLWAESRLAKLFSKNPGRPHDLLGLDMAEGTVEEMRWRNVLKINELKWLAGHSLQGQIVFPATAYIAIAMEAAMQMAAATGGAGTSVLSIDLLELRIPKAIALNDSGTELVTSMTHIKRHSGGEPGDDVITAEFNAFSTTGKEATSMALNCTGRVRILLGPSSNSSSPDQKVGEEEAEAEKATWPSRFAARVAPQGHLSTIDVDRFYQVLRDDFGFGYYGAFHGLTSIQRKTNYSTATIRNPAFEKDETPLLFHPGMLDSALQGLNAAYSAPGDGRLWSIVAPTAVRRITLVPDLCGDKMTDEVLIDCTITDPRPNCVTGDVNVYLSIPCEESEELGGGSKNITKQCIEVEGITFSPFAAATKDDDRLLFQEAILTLDKPDATLIYGDRKATPWEKQKALDAERAAFFYLKNLHVSIDAEKRTELPWYRQALLSNAERIYNRVKDGQHPFVPPSGYPTRERTWWN